jgi:DNA gyrase subunit A
MSDDDTTGTMPPETDRVEPRRPQHRDAASYIEYAMSVIVSRALPDVRDGLKPVHRRVLYAMYDGGYRPDRGFNKCSRVVGDVMGSTTRTATRPSTTPSCASCSRGRCVTRSCDGQGNFGSPGNDPAAARDTPSARWPSWPWRWSATSTRTPSTSSRTTTARPSSRGPAEPLPQPARQRQWHRRRHGHQHPAAQPREVAMPPQWVLEHPDASREETCSRPHGARSRGRTSRPAP